MRLDVSIVPHSLSVAVNPAAVEVGFGYPVAREVVGTPYEGDYAVTPSAERQTLATEGTWMRHDVTIEPIPSNYGRIEWNGNTLTVL